MIHPRLRPLPPARPPGGFSLVEIVLALGLVSFSLLAIFGLVAQGHKTSRESRLESVAALLAGRATSLLRASSAWETNIDEFTGTKSLSDIGAGTATQTLTNYYDINLEKLTDPADPNRQFAMTTAIGPLDPVRLRSADPGIAGSVSRLPAAGNTVFLAIEISYPAQAPEANRSKRSFSSIITRTSRD
jgi:Tfp pilus assembly protein PilV